MILWRANGAELKFGATDAVLAGRAEELLAASALAGQGWFGDVVKWDLGGSLRTTVGWKVARHGQSCPQLCLARDTAAPSPQSADQSVHHELDAEGGAHSGGG